ncbi:hypothetical protein [Luteithermobacter gelatinilyticus]|uniref:hypothetical protein n=1 Tax=Luteithermobacter gelatinilyticus TaxID=2582913 RepID=UPI0011071E78|nr:hypothetical protein [Luteithermobacter gelatinilyticus]
MNYRLIATSFLLNFLLTISASHAAEEKNTLTHGMVQMTLKVGETTQLAVAEAFGAPNITTIDGNGQEVWIYRRHATVSTSKTNSKSFVIGLGFGAGGVGGGAGAGIGNATTGFEQSSRTMTLIIKFNGEKIVSDFRSRSSSF